MNYFIYTSRKFSSSRNYFSDGQVRVRGVATDEYNRSLVRNRVQSGESASSFEQHSGEVNTCSLRK